MGVAFSQTTGEPTRNATMHQSCFTLLVLGLAIATKADASPTHHESQHATPSRDEWQEDTIPWLSHGHATNGNQVREKFFGGSYGGGFGGGDETTSACLVDRNSAWKGYDCSKKTCQKYAPMQAKRKWMRAAKRAARRWAADMEACCNADAGKYDCTADWCLDKRWNSFGAKLGLGVTGATLFYNNYYSCNDKAMKGYCKADSKWYKDASECCPTHCGVKPSGRSGMLDGLKGFFGGKSDETDESRETGSGETDESGETGSDDWELFGR